MAGKVALLFALCAVGVASAHVPVENWESFKTAFVKTYSSNEHESFRRGVFHDNLRFIHRHNALNRSYTVAMNEFGDLTGEEFAKIYLNKVSRRRATNASPPKFSIHEEGHLPGHIDWREEGYVTEVKNQGRCGSCWSFSTTGSLEGQHFRKTGRLISLSEQQLVSCDKLIDHGCEGGLMDFAFNYIKSHGIESEVTYPYVSGDGSVPPCKYHHSSVVATVSGYVDIPEGSEEHLTAAVASVGPVSVAIDASQRSFHFYQSGVYDEPQCSSTQLDHGVLAAGYGTLAGKDYYLVKNSWGPKWGESGYIRMARNKNNQCGLATSPSYPLVF